MPQYISTVNSRELGSTIRQALVTLEITGKGLADILGLSETKVSRVLKGVSALSQEDLSAILAICRITGISRDKAMSLNVGLPNSYSHVEHERLLRNNLRLATSVAEYGGSTIPPILQTGKYARQILHQSPGVPTEDISQIIAFRARSRRVIQSFKDATCTFFIPEHALHLPDGDDSTMVEQCRELLRLGKPRHIELRVLPTEAGVHAGLTGGPWTVLDLKDCPTVVCERNMTGARFVEDEPLVRAYQKAIGSLLGAALDTTDSRDLISSVISDFRVPNRETAQAGTAN